MLPLQDYETKKQGLEVALASEGTILEKKMIGTKSLRKYANMCTAAVFEE